MQLLKNFLHNTYSREAYNAYLNSDNWKTKREQILIRDCHQCKVCRNKSSILEVHHLTYDHVMQEHPYELITLCNECHNRLHEIKKLINCNLRVALIKLCKEKNTKLIIILPKKPKFQRLNYERNIKWLKRKNKL